MGVTNGETGRATRRALLVGAGAAGVATSLAGCGDSGGSSDAGGGGGPIKTSDIPVNGGKVFQNPNTVVTQPQAGTFKAFSATCTHQGCTVSKVENNTISCPCHGSQFSAVDGSVQNGPATQPLPTMHVTVNGDTVTVG